MHGGATRGPVLLALAAWAAAAPDEGCTITAKNCPEYERKQFRDHVGEEHVGAGGNDAACLKRAEDFHHWCGNGADSGAQVAATYNPAQWTQVYHPGACERGWSQWDAFCYKHYWEKKNWFEAEKLCLEPILLLPVVLVAKCVPLRPAALAGAGVIDLCPLGRVVGRGHLGARVGPVPAPVVEVLRPLQARGVVAAGADVLLPDGVAELLALVLREVLAGLGRNRAAHVRSRSCPGGEGEEHWSAHGAAVHR